MTMTAQFEIQYYQYIDEHGKPTQSLPEFTKDHAKLVEFYKYMVQLRAYDTKAIALQRTGKMGTYASTLGQEAISVAIGEAMQKEDVLCPYYRDYGAQLQRGITMEEIYTYWGGDERGSHYAHNTKDLSISVPIASQCLHAAGVATAFKIQKKPHVAVVTCGDGGTSEGDFYEAINVAGAWNLPVVFVINNNQWAISVPLKQQTATQTIAQKAIAGGFSGIQVDGNDIIAVYDLFSKALEKARTGGGPTLIEALTYRLCDHTTADDASRYRDKKELENAWQKEPILRLQKYLMQQNLWDDKKEETLLAECAEKVEKSVQAYFNKTPQTLSSIFDYHYAVLPESLEKQRDEALKEHHHA
ncbi:MAG: pyruvate dehydrogenase (acetyl-transferring) E1 component subunit alpha [Proteobacteria bacterium]|nr:pyruvate dehydrogenase (acetyl-transferring) E1 component subunit alpha [Pseudomonadota bacterium]